MRPSTLNRAILRFSSSFTAFVPPEGISVRLATLMNPAFCETMVAPDIELLPAKLVEEDDLKKHPANNAALTSEAFGVRRLVAAFVVTPVSNFDYQSGDKSPHSKRLRIRR